MGRHRPVPLLVLADPLIIVASGGKLNVPGTGPS
jgi:hypothetical protein